MIVTSISISIIIIARCACHIEVKYVVLSSKHYLTFKPFGFPTLNSKPLPGQLVLVFCIGLHLPGMEQS